ncbi:MAG: S41 family peptidase [Pseudomonadota bacterium]
MSLKTRAILVITIGLVLGLGLPLSAHWLEYRFEPPADRAVIDAALMAEVMARVRHDYVDDVPDDVLMQAAIRGMVAALDPHSEFLDPDEYADLKVSSSGNYSGIGIEVAITDGAIQVVAPFDDTPAARAGIRPGDIISQINNVPVDIDGVGDAVTRLRGKPGSRVDLHVIREGESRELHFSMTRTYVKVVSVREQSLRDRFGYVRISQFNESTAGDVKRSLRRLRRDIDGELDGLVIDLRNNPGGVLDAAVHVADLFLDNGLIVSARGRGDGEVFAHAANPGDVLDGANIVILVNDGSASASEIVAGALSDHGRALLVGTTTYGKGSVQTVMPLANGNAIKLTTSRYYTPSGRSIHDVGIQPDFEIPIDDDVLLPTLRMSGGPISTEDDPQLARAVKFLEQPYFLQSRAP